MSEPGTIPSEFSPPARTITRLALLIVALGAAWRIVRYAVGFPLWGDEAFLVESVFVRDFEGMTRPLEFAQVAPVGYMWAMLASTKAFGTSEWAMRFPSFLCGLLALFLFWQLARRTLDRSSAPLAIGIFTVSYYVVRHFTVEEDSQFAKVRRKNWAR